MPELIVEQAVFYQSQFLKQTEKIFICRKIYF